MDFTENLLLKLPDLRGQGGVKGVSENHHYDRNMHESLVVEIDAIHEGMTSNFNYYSREELAKSVESWYTPYPKPLIKNHDQMTEPLGRVMHAEMQTDGGLPFIKLQVAVTDPDAVEKVLDGRYLTGSVGGKTDVAICSICGENWGGKNLHEGIPCNHRRGQTYKGEVASLMMKDITWKEYSIVNIPADNLSTIRGAVDMDETHKVGLFALNMSEQEIYGINDDGVTNLLEGLRKKEARPLYMQTKGAFLSALAQSKLSIDPDEEAELDIDTKEEEDILAVVENLSDDLAAAAEESDSADDSEEVVAEEDQNEEDVAAEEQADETDEVEAPVAEEEAADTDVEEEAPVEADEETLEATEEDNKDSATAEEQVAEEEEAENAVAEEDSAIDELKEQLAALSAKVEELTADKQTLLDTVDKLKTALKRGLAERVVDSKIALGYEEADKRSELVEEHMGRSASSLADFLSDFASMTVEKAEKPVDTDALPETETKAVSIDEDADVDDENTVEESENPQEEIDPVKFFNDLLMGRRSL